MVALTAVSTIGAWWASVADVLREPMTVLLGVIGPPMLLYFFAINTSYLVLVLLAASEFLAHLRRSAFSGRAEAVSSRLAPGVSLIVPAHNESAGIVMAVQSLLSLRHPRHEVVVVDDGSTDDTFEQLRARFDLVEVAREVPRDIPVPVEVSSVHVPDDGVTRLAVIRKPNSGKTDAVNTGINAAVEPLIAVVDADSILEPDALIAVAEPFAEDPVRTIATGGVIRAANGCTVVDGRVVEVGMPRQWVGRIQVVEYLRAFLLGRSGWSSIDALVLISGAFGMFRRDILVEIGGLDRDCIGEDFELVVRMHRHMRDAGRPYRIRFVAEPIAWTEVPTSLRVLRSQRRRWHRGLYEVLVLHAGMLFRPRYGRIGFLALPWLWLFELVVPVLEIVGITIVLLSLAVGVTNLEFALFFLLVTYGYALLVNLASMTIEELSFHKYPRWKDLGVAIVASVLENFGYRQLNVWWRCEGLVQGLRRGTHEWGTMTRAGFGGTAPRGTGAGVGHA
ncbi:glycosyltransferase family 2 protein [Mobilicoccus caccae]|uniref:Glycosyl transferase family 2 n=1 Tax=Mobilicoccus caccae TaxID=1859295 RepID=A0ABQ6ILB4_9MICO|nr:glycosyltransferase [Mobilicoccus caccae]GMA38695.1 glycosyl transferase family 2 [Mobilicoccus caccae]